PVAHDHQDRILSLPIYPEMTDEMIRYVVNCVAEGIAACG
ncbi:MAG: UDP-4-amino-4,6-dideoxy-N-acetyl-beta-L-altrosamine transaminase, partial [Gammaproteobacteria bacterium]|nr:UDP-4-amino-4,6-dideoxy-N-acetyl-beta-L-altrosamine transaminase [Gammaproteobacteria bacterium]